MSDGPRERRWQVWGQVPFLIWLVALWMLLWGQFTLTAFITGVIVALVVTRVFLLPPIHIPLRVNPWYLFVLVVTFLAGLVRGSLLVAWQVLRPGKELHGAIIAVQLRTDDDLIMTHTAIAGSLIPGTLTLEADRERRILYLHVLNARTPEEIEHQRRALLGWEARIVRALGSREQVRAIRESAVQTPRQGGAPI